MSLNKIKNIELQYTPLNSEELIELSVINDNLCCNLELKSKKEIKVKNLSIALNFNEEIFEWRNQDYQWVKCNMMLIASDLSTKCISFKDGVKAIPSKNIGLWEFNAKNKKQLIWRLEDKFLSPIIQFDEDNNKVLIDTFSFDRLLNLNILFSDKKIPEFSRSKIPFSAVLCFTDHCDFDSKILIEKQRKLFKELELKVTKGFFLNHFSKRDFNISHEREKEELLSWVSDGHELSYHSLTQSIRNELNSKEEFEKFNPPFSGVTTWIDHGFQPYNFTLLKRSHQKIDDWILKQNKKNIYNFWTYNDCGSGADGIINQLNLNHFTPIALLKSLNKRSLFDKIQTFIRSYLFYFSENKKAVYKYKTLANVVKSILYKKEFTKIFQLIVDGLYLFFYFIKVLFSWRVVKNEPSKYAKYTPVFFRNSSFKGNSLFFQTLEINNFTETFSDSNIENLINEKGICIAHTYFSVLFEYHKGRLFLNEKGDFNVSALNVFKLISNKVKDNKIWNPTLQDFIDYYQKYKNVELGIDLKGEIVFLHHTKEISYRFI